MCRGWERALSQSMGARSVNPAHRRSAPVPPVKRKKWEPRAAGRRLIARGESGLVCRWRRGCDRVGGAIRWWNQSSSVSVACPYLLVPQRQRDLDYVFQGVKCKWAAQRSPTITEGTVPREGAA
eukprot:scaffold2450_cov401-Prasinococcus_capsulatus_cf.AAC.10